jgi:ABC-2 type transport system permease protein
MWTIFTREVSGFFSALIGYMVVGLFLLVMGLILFVWPQTSLLDGNYATLDQLFDIAPMIFTFLMPAITMRSFAEEFQSGAIELLATRPLRTADILLGKFFATLALVALALAPTLLYYITVYQLGAPKGNLDAGAVFGSYLGLLLLAAAFSAIGLMASALQNNQITAFLLAAFLCFLLHWGFDLFSSLPVFSGRGDAVIQAIGMQSHYASVSRGVVDSRDVIYFLSVIVFFLAATGTALRLRR